MIFQVLEEDVKTKRLKQNQKHEESEGDDLSTRLIKSLYLSKGLEDHHRASVC